MKTKIELGKSVKTLIKESVNSTWTPIWNSVDNLTIFPVWSLVNDSVRNPITNTITELIITL